MNPVEGLGTWKAFKAKRGSEDVLHYPPIILASPTESMNTRGMRVNSPLLASQLDLFSEASRTMVQSSPQPWVKYGNWDSLHPDEDWVLGTTAFR